LQNAEARPFVRSVGAFGGAGAEPFDDGAAELLEPAQRDRRLPIGEGIPIIKCVTRPDWTA
jgi:hypothetical protein